MTEPETYSVPSPRSGAGTEPSVPPGFAQPAPGSLRQAVPPPGYAYHPAAFGYPPPVVTVGGERLAEAADRFLAFLIDSAILGAVMIVPIGIVIAVVFQRMSDRLDIFRGAEPGEVPDAFHHFGDLLKIELAGLAILIPLSLLASYVYYVTLAHRTGQTPGKKALNIRVVRVTDGAAITLGAARKRWLVNSAVGLFAPYFTYADHLWLLWDKPYRQCLHDKCAETVVVKVSRE